MKGFLWRKVVVNIRFEARTTTTLYMGSHQYVSILLIYFFLVGVVTNVFLTHAGRAWHEILIRIFGCLNAIWPSGPVYNLSIFVTRLTRRLSPFDCVLYPLYVNFRTRVGCCAPPFSKQVKPIFEFRITVLTPNLTDLLGKNITLQLLFLLHGTIEYWTMLLLLRFWCSDICLC